MALTKSSGFSIPAVINVIPEQRSYNNSLALIADNERKRLIETTGINERRIAALNSIEKYFSYGIDKLLQQCNWDALSIDVVICITQTARPSIPSVACVLQGKHKFRTDTLCFDINPGCSGYVYGLQTAMALLNLISNDKARAIVCCGDLSSLLLAPDDATTQPIFSDAVSITAVTKAPSHNTVYFNTSTYGEGRNAIYTETSGHKEVMRLNGIDVFNYSVQYVPPHINQLLQYAEMDIPQVDLFVFHQANKLINSTIGKILNIPTYKTPETLSLYGNTASASIPITLDHNIRNSGNMPNTMVLCGFGVGFSIASALIKTNEQITTFTYEWQ